MRKISIVLAFALCSVSAFAQEAETTQAQSISQSSASSAVESTSQSIGNVLGHIVKGPMDLFAAVGKSMRKGFSESVSSTQSGDASVDSGTNDASAAKAVGSMVGSVVKVPLSIATSIGSNVRKGFVDVVSAVPAEDKSPILDLNGNVLSQRTSVSSSNDALSALLN